MNWEVGVIDIVFILVAGGIAWLMIRKGELRELADTRGKRIDDLTAEVAALTAKVASIEGQMEAIQRIKAEEIAIEVARLLGDTFRGVT